jgi:O-Antigen ligase
VVSRRSGPALGLGLAIATVALCFHGGAYYAGATGLVCAGVALGLGARAAIVRRPFPGVGVAVAVATIALAAFTVWILISSRWSHAPARALFEYDRALLYGLVVLAFAACGRSAERIRWLLLGVAGGALVVCLAGLVTRLAPDLWSVTPNLHNERLSYPVGYWNALGLLAAVGTIACGHLAASERELPAVRVAGAAALPVLTVALVLTFSRSGIAVAAGGIGLYLLLARPRGAPGALLAAGPAVAVAVSWALGAELLAQPDPTTPAAVAQGHELALVLAGCVPAAALLRMATLRFDDELADAMEEPGRRRSARVAGGLALAAVVVVALALGVTRDAASRVDAFLGNARVETGDRPLRDRLTKAGGKDRSLLWRASLAEYRRAPAHGSGAGTFQLTWEAARPPKRLRGELIFVVDGHSLYLETLGELGWPGLALLLVALGAMLARFAWLARGPDRSLGSVLLAAGLAWCVHAAFDWDWEVPGVTLWLFAAAGLALARPETHPPSPGGWHPVARVAAVLGLAVLAAAPLQVARSQREVDRAVAALHAGDCAAAVPAARRASAILGVRPEPPHVEAVCDLRAGRSQAALREAARARRLDPGDWTQHYTEALVRASVGLDPRPAMARALRRDPQGAFTKGGMKALATGRRTAWRRRAPRLPLPPG